MSVVNVKLLAALGVLAVPFGVPLVFYLNMRAAVQESDGANENAAGGAKLVSDDILIWMMSLIDLRSCVRTTSPNIGIGSQSATSGSWF